MTCADFAPYAHCHHHWRPTAIDADPATGRVYWARYTCSLCHATEDVAPNRLTYRAITRSDPGPLDDYLPLEFTVDDYTPYPLYGAVSASEAMCEREVA